ncbi:MAG: glycosyltransferase [Thermoguttaceae bacterium]|nr:glycosyltransferase [Thermoguttaceae bacterium]MDW8037993.1 glycosyltransferase [Thermoguttaceae bacterium]
MPTPLVSVVIPVYNGEAYVGQAIESVLAQTWPHIELIVVNDGSTDGSAEVIGRYRDRLLLVEQTNQGVAAARNAGIQRAKGELIALLDQDDWWRPEKLARQVPLLLNNPRVGLVHTAVDHYDQDRQQWVGPLNPQARPERLVGQCFRQLLLENQIYNSTVLIRAEALRQVGLCDLSIQGNTVQDYDLWLRIARHWDLAYVPEPLVVFRIHSRQGTWDRRQMLSEEARLLERVLAEHQLTNQPELRHRMARLYDQLGTAQLDAGDRRSAQQSFRRSLQWSPTGRARLLWLICWMPTPLIHTLQKIWHRRLGRAADPVSSDTPGNLSHN